MQRQARMEHGAPTPGRTNQAKSTPAVQSLNELAHEKVSRQIPHEKIPRQIPGRINDGPGPVRRGNLPVAPRPDAAARLVTAGPGPPAEAGGNLTRAEESLSLYLGLKRDDSAAWAWYARLTDERTKDKRGRERVFLVNEEAWNTKRGQAVQSCEGRGGPKFLRRKVLLLIPRHSG
jgi:hypothetical protein